MIRVRRKEHLYYLDIDGKRSNTIHPATTILQFCRLDASIEYRFLFNILYDEIERAMKTATGCYGGWVTLDPDVEAQLTQARLSNGAE